MDEINLDESMQETLKSLQGSEETEVNEEIETTDDLDESGDDKPSRSRDDKGRFAKKAEEADEPAVEEEAEEVVEQEAEPVEDVKLNRPPSTWTPEAKSIWKDLPPRARQEILKREEDGMRGVSQMRERASYGERLQQIINPYTPLISAQGSTPEQTIQSLLNTAYRLNTASPKEKAELLLETAKRYGADMSVFGNPQAVTAASPADSKIRELEEKLARFEQSTVQVKQTEAMNKIEAFANAENESGELKYPYFENVRNQMAVLIEAAHHEGRTLSLEEAYDAAVWSHPDTRRLMMTAQSSDAERKRQEEAKRRAANAQKANKVNLSKKGSHDLKQPKPTGSVDDTLREAMENIKSRQP